MATETWLGGDGDWNNPANWSGGQVPGSADDVVVAIGDPTIDGSVPEIQSLTVDAGAAATVASGGAVTVSGLVEDLGTIVLNSATGTDTSTPADADFGQLGGNGAIDITGPALPPSLYDENEVYDTLTVGLSSTLYQNVTLVNDANFNLAQLSTIAAGASLSLSNQAIVGENLSPGESPTGASLADLSMNQGALSLSGDETELGGPFVNEGTIILDDASLIGEGGYPRTGDFINNGSISIRSGDLAVSGVDGTGTITLGDGSEIEVASETDGLSSGQTIYLKGDDNIVYGGMSNGLNATIAGFDSTDKITFQDISAYDLPLTPVYNAAAQTVTVTYGTLTYVVHLTGDFSGEYFHLDDGDGGVALTVSTTPCFCRGTLIDTARGPVAVEAIEVGDQIRILDGGFSPVTWVGRRRVGGSGIGCGADAPIRIEAGAIDGTLPVRPLLVSPNHAIHIDGVLVPAGLMVDGDRIRIESVDRAEYFHVELAEHAILFAEGQPAESYLDTGNRAQYANCPLAYDPISATQDACAPMVVAGTRLEDIRALLRAVRVQQEELTAA